VPFREKVKISVRHIQQDADASGHANGESPPLANILRKLVLEVRAQTNESADDVSGGLRVLCEVVLDNERYVLLRGPALDPVEALSPREREILWLICDGKSNLAIAQALRISPWTVSSYLRRVFAKLGVSTRTGAAALVLSCHPGGHTTAARGEMPRDGARRR